MLFPTTADAIATNAVTSGDLLPPPARSCSSKVRGTPLPPSSATQAFKCSSNSPLRSSGAGNIPWIPMHDSIKEDDTGISRPSLQDGCVTGEEN